jgi:hypothetical protein
MPTRQQLDIDQTYRTEPHNTVRIAGIMHDRLTAHMRSYVRGN